MFLDLEHRPFGVEANEIRPDTYLTDGVRLYRVCRELTGGRDEAVELENCRDLSLIVCSKLDLASSGMRIVRPAGEVPETLAGVGAGA